jgi:polysaccharide chain length determinant protein (PEP-CTERM system associated)
MQELLNQLLGYARGVWRYRWIILIIAWPIAVIGWVQVVQMPNVYRASAQVHVDTDSLLRPLMRGLAVDVNLQQQVNMMTRTLLTRPNLEQIARITDLHLEAQTPQQMDRVVNQLRSGISISGGQRENIYTIAYQHGDPVQAHAVVQGALTFFVETALGETRGEGDAVQLFLQQQIEEFEQRLEAAERRRAEFRRQNIGLMPGDRGDYYQRLQSVQGQLQEAELRLREAENRRDEIERQLIGEEPVFGIMGDNAMGSETTSVDPRINELKGRLDDLLLTYTERHPDVAILQRRIEDLEQQRQQELALLRQTRPTGGGGLETNPVHQQMRMALSNAQVEVSSLRVRVEDYQNQIQELQRLVDVIPEVEAELARLDRDYNIVRSNYQSLLERREQARMTQTLEQRGENIQFRVVEPARVPRSPSGPNRPLFYTAVLVVGLGAGGGLAFLVSLLRPVFDNRKSLSQGTGFPVLGSVSRLPFRRLIVKERLELASFVGVAGLLLASYGLMLTMGERLGALL